jgi:hypothetical protein
MKQMTFRLHNCACAFPRETPARIGVHFGRYSCRYFCVFGRTSSKGKLGQFGAVNLWGLVVDVRLRAARNLCGRGARSQGSQIQTRSLQSCFSILGLGTADISLPVLHAFLSPKSFPFASRKSSYGPRCATGRSCRSMASL